MDIVLFQSLLNLVAYSEITIEEVGQRILTALKMVWWLNYT